MFLTMIFRRKQKREKGYLRQMEIVQIRQGQRKLDVDGEKGIGRNL